MSDVTYTFTKYPVDIGRLEFEINSSSIIITLHGITLDGTDQVNITFNGALSADSEAILNAIILNHTGEPLPIIPNIVSLDGPKDPDGRILTRQATTRDGWAYSPRSLDFYTSKYKSLYNRKHNGAGIDDGTDMGDALMKFYDTNGTELVKAENESDADFQTRLDSSCIKTFVDFEPTFDIDIYGCKLMFESAPIDRAYLWAIVAPDVPEAYGGSKAFMGGGMNLKMMLPKEIGYTDGKSSKLIRYDPVYHSGKIRLILKHSLGEKLGIQMIYEFYQQ